MSLMSARRRWWWLPVLLGWAAGALGHGLGLTTAGVTLRNQNHLTLHLQYDPVRLWARVNGGGAADPATLARLPDEAFAAGYGALRTHLREQVRILFGEQPLASPRFRFPDVATFRRSVRERFMRGVMEGAADHRHPEHDHRHDGDPRRYYQDAWVDGFLPTGGVAGELELRLPASLGEVMVTYSRPRSWTLQPGDEGVRHRFSLSSD